jgi:hypothetical protein
VDNGSGEPGKLWVPPELQFQQRWRAHVEQEAQALAEWARKWPRPEKREGERVLRPAEKPLGGGDVTEAVLLRARIYLWDRDTAEAIGRRAMELLGLVRPKPVAVPDRRPLTGSQRRRERRAGRPGTGEVTVMPAGAADPQGGGDAHRFGRGTPDARNVADAGDAPRPGQPRA